MLSFLFSNGFILSSCSLEHLNIIENRSFSRLKLIIRLIIDALIQILELALYGFLWIFVFILADKIHRKIGEGLFMHPFKFL